jgi:hypothetical protein
MKEVVEDLEWPGGDVQLSMWRDPASLVMSASGTGRLEVGLCGWAVLHVVRAGLRAAVGHRCAALRCSCVTTAVGERT